MEVTEAIQDPVEEELDSEEEKKFAAKAYMKSGKIKNGEIVYSDSSSDPDHNLIKPPWWKVPEWGVDSFDELEYDSAKEANAFSDDEKQKRYCRFKRQLIKNKGFYVEPELWSFHGYVGLGIIRDLEGNAGHGQTYREYFTDMANLCLKKYNKKKNRETNGFDVEFVEVVRGMYTGGSRSKSYITFMAREKPDGPSVEYQCKVWCTFQKGQNYPILCRPAPLVKVLD